MRRTLWCKSLLDGGCQTSPGHLWGISFPQKYNILIHAPGYLGDSVYRESVRGIIYMQVCFSGASPGHLFPKEYAPGHFRGISGASGPGHHLHAGLLLLKGSTPFGAYINNKGWYGVRDLRARVAPRRTTFQHCILSFSQTVLALYPTHVPQPVTHTRVSRNVCTNLHPRVSEPLLPKRHSTYTPITLFRETDSLRKDINHWLLEHIINPLALRAPSGTQQCVAALKPPHCT